MDRADAGIDVVFILQPAIVNRPAPQDSRLPISGRGRRNHPPRFIVSLAITTCWIWLVPS
jgi:hypothetical protein